MSLRRMVLLASQEEEHAEQPVEQGSNLWHCVSIGVVPLMKLELKLLELPCVLRSCHHGEEVIKAYVSLSSMPSSWRRSPRDGMG